VYTLSCPAVGGKPNCSFWDFESSSSEGWEFAPLGAASAAAGALVTSTAQKTSGAASLAIAFDNGGDVDKYVEIRVQLCAGGNVLDLTGKQIRWKFKNAPNTPYGYNYLILYDSSNFGGFGGVLDFGMVGDGAWDSYVYDIFPSISQVFGIGFHLQATDAYNGTLYLDDIAIY
jgi:hypothetical protein